MPEITQDSRSLYTCVACHESIEPDDLAFSSAYSVGAMAYHDTCLAKRLRECPPPSGPTRPIGVCDRCGSEVWRGMRYAYNADGRQVYHRDCDTTRSTANVRTELLQREQEGERSDA